MGLSVARAWLAETPSRIPTAATMTWRMPLPAWRRSPNSADTIPAYAGCRATTTTAAPLAARPSSSLHQGHGAHPTMTEFCALSHAESARHIAQTPAILGSQILRLACRWRGLWLIHDRRNRRDRHNRNEEFIGSALWGAQPSRAPPLASGSRSWCRVMLPSGARSATQCCIAERF